MKSIERGNAVFGIHVNSIRDKHGQVKVAGPNPFSYIGLHVSQDAFAFAILVRKTYPCAVLASAQVAEPVRAVRMPATAKFNAQ